MVAGALGDQGVGHKKGSDGVVWLWSSVVAGALGDLGIGEP